MPAKTPQPESNAAAETDDDDHSNEHLLGSILSFPLQPEESAVEVDPEQILSGVLADPNVTQQMTRTSAEGVDTVVAYFRCDFTQDQERSIVHLPLVPPMSHVPDVQATVTDESLARIRITDRQKFGVRLEVIRSGAEKPAVSLMIEIIASGELPLVD